MSDRIEINPRICGGKPVVRGTRIAVAVLLELLSEGESWETILRSYPELQRNDLQAVLQYARAAVLHTDFTTLEPA